MFIIYLRFHKIRYFTWLSGFISTGESGSSTAGLKCDLKRECPILRFCDGFWLVKSSYWSTVELLVKALNDMRVFTKAGLVSRPSMVLFNELNQTLFLLNVCMTSKVSTTKFVISFNFPKIAKNLLVKLRARLINGLQLEKPKLFWYFCQLQSWLNFIY